VRSVVRMTPCSSPSYDHVKPIRWHFPTNPYSYHDDSSDDELVQDAEHLEVMLEEMRVWDAEDAENKALGRIIPGSNPPPQPYQESDEFIRLAEEVRYIAAIQRRRIEEIVEDEVLEDPIEDTQEFIPPPHHCTPVFHLASVKR
jgi:hypothetical protein